MNVLWMKTQISCVVGKSALVAVGLIATKQFQNTTLLAKVRD